MDEHALTARLPDAIAQRVQSVTVKQGRVSLVIDASGFAADRRAGIESAIKDILGEAEGVAEVRVAMMADKAAAPLIIAIGSGKGGVGKSTLTANLAVALQRLGKKIGVVDADVYGPSQPTLFDNKGIKPDADGEKLVPVPSRHNIPVLSMGHLVEAGQALAWRGPMAGNAMAQLVDARWGDAELLLIDLPPGTGDVQLTMLSKFKPAGAVIVSTPQDLALIDAQRAANLFESGNVPIIGLVENMSGYACPSCGEVSNPFGTGGVEAASDATDIPFLGRIPLALDIRRSSDAGDPLAGGDSDAAQPFHAIARHLARWLDTPRSAGES
ncbi:Mrp/NBP35 family ATP-binding protein [Pontixanthobacter sp.]|uniref:Mrp/NBP35 family ATP-binding protein n=1 Tax=Pontixanthobacter sp. TaxID=2792078 RepID=UPI003C79BFFA